MKHILILADGNIAEHFIDWLNKKRVAENRYHIVFNDTQTIPDKIGRQVRLFNIDPTSFSKLKQIMQNTKYSSVFILLQNPNEAEFALKNVHDIDSKIRVVLLNLWGKKCFAYIHENVMEIDTEALTVAHLYEHLPNVPLIAQNIGRGEGEIMEVYVPFGSAYAYRHIGSIVQRKWQIAALYRKKKQILPTIGTMIHPEDTLLIVGRPSVLNNVYNTVNQRTGLLPEPFGRDLYLLIDCAEDYDNVESYILEGLYFASKLEKRKLHIRILNLNNFMLLEKLRAYNNDNVNVLISYDVPNNHFSIIEYDIYNLDIGLIFCSIKRFKKNKLQKLLYDLKKIIYLFGNISIKNIERSVVMLGIQEKLEPISSTAFDATLLLNLKLTLCNFDPEGEFNQHKKVIEHYEALTQIFNTEVNVEQKIANPIKEMKAMGNILQIAPFERKYNKYFWNTLLSTNTEDFLLTTHDFPKLLVPYTLHEE